MDLRPCHFEPGSEAQIVRICTSPEVMEVKEIRSWTVQSIITEVRNGPYNALGKPFAAGDVLSLELDLTKPGDGVL